MYKPQEIEKKWREIWQRDNLYKTREDTARPKYYILDMFPYPSGAGLHVGHPKGYIATDIFARHKMMTGYNVLHPMGFDAFGLPAENYAIKNKVNPRIATAKSVELFKKQLEILGFSYDWEREINTTDPKYYKWTQWIFLQIYKAGLAYESNEPINWCPSCKTGLANEDLEGGRCERCGSEIEKRPMRQWVLRIRDYADRLLADLDKLEHWDESTKEMQRHWIGRSEGAEIDFSVPVIDKSISAFTTRLDTIYGCTYLVLAPEHELIELHKETIENYSELEDYKNSLKAISEEERTSLNREKTGVKIKGWQAINPFTNEKIDIYIADYVLASYGTGAVMAVPAHDQRDYDFAKKYGLRIKTVITDFSGNSPYEGKQAYEDDGQLINSDKYDNLPSVLAREEMLHFLEANKLGQKKVNYRLQNWVFSRQRYWGEPIPLVHCEKCGVVPVPEAELPLELPDVENYQPTGTGESPLAAIAEWVNTACPQCSGPAKRETNTMPQWAGSCWYYLRYIDPDNDKALVDSKKEKYWSPVDFYVGGAEHATRHLIYARFWHKFLFDIGVVSNDEPFVRLKHVGLIMGEDSRKMSKRWGNVVDPTDIVNKYGADSLRLYEMFMGPFEQASAWNTKGLSGVYKFLEKTQRAINPTLVGKEDQKLKSLLHKTIKKVGADIEEFRFNTAISSLMILVNEITNQQRLTNKNPLTASDQAKLIQLLAPFAPHLSEELWLTLGNKESVFRSQWPQYDEVLIKDDEVNVAIQVNGKLRGTLMVASDISEAEIMALVLADEKISQWIRDKEIVKKIFVPGKIFNLVVK